MRYTIRLAHFQNKTDNPLRISYWDADHYIWDARKKVYLDFDYVIREDFHKEPPKYIVSTKGTNLIPLWKTRLVDLINEEADFYDQEMIEYLDHIDIFEFGLPQK
jgi:hypothetical protein